MNESQLIRFRAVIRSLSESTAVTLTAEGLVARVSGRCSPYRSHRTVNHHWVDKKEGWHAVNNRYQIVINPPSELDIVPMLGGSHPNHKLDWEAQELPRPLLEPLLQEFNRWLGVQFPQFPPLVSCAMPMPQVAAFVGGKPVFRFNRCDWTNNECIESTGWTAYRASDDTPEDWPAVVPPASLPGLAIRTGGSISGNPNLEPAHGWFDYRPWWLVLVERPDVDIMSKAGTPTPLPKGRWWVTVDDTH